MAVKRQVSKKKLKKWIEENHFTANGIYYVNAEELEQTIDSGELDMTKDWRLTKDE